MWERAGLHENTMQCQAGKENLFGWVVKFRGGGFVCYFSFPWSSFVPSPFGVSLRARVEPPTAVIEWMRHASNIDSPNARHKSEKSLMGLMTAGGG